MSAQPIYIVQRIQGLFTFEGSTKTGLVKRYLFGACQKSEEFLSWAPGASLQKCFCLHFLDLKDLLLKLFQLKVTWMCGFIMEG